MIDLSTAPIQFLLGKRWIDGAGNTYHTVTAYIGNVSHTSAIEYGGDTHYLQTALEVFKIGRCVAHDVVDVKRRKDL